jgi:Ca2+-transporting ATPase
MEKAIHNLYKTTHTDDQRNAFQQIHEYPLSGHPPIMTHIFKSHENIIVASKGAPESIIKQSTLSEKERDEVNIQIKKYANSGFRVLGIGKAMSKENNWPKSQDEFTFEFLGLIAFQDPPKPNMINTVEIFRTAGIQFKMITGDFPETAVAIAKQINIENPENVITGDQILKLNPEELALKVKNTNVFARMFPEAKLKIIEALKLNGEITAMTGDGVNDAPALKAAHIGISMGNNGSEVAKSAASLIITDDNLAHMTDAIELGRRIYDNLAKAVLYIVSIHIPIILIVLIPTFLSSSFNTIFSPVHVIFLELIMGPTCSIIYENEPVEVGSMLKPPRKKTMTFLSSQQLSISIIQGIIITVGCFLAGYFFYRKGGDQTAIRSVVFITLLFSNIFLTLFNRSYYYSVFTTIKYKNYLLPIMIFATLSFIFIIQYFPLTRSLFDLKILSPTDIFICLIFAFITTYWFEIFKWFKRKRKPILLS